MERDSSCAASAALVHLDGILVVRLSGELDMSCADTTEHRVMTLIGDAPHTVLDLCDLDFMDAAGIRTLVGVERAVSARGAVVKLRGVSPLHRRLLAISGLEHLLEKPGVAVGVHETDADRCARGASG